MTPEGPAAPGPNQEDGRPRILVLIKGLGLGGAERLLSESIPFLDRDRYEYEICYFTPWKDDVVDRFENAGLPIYCLEIENDANPANLRKLRRFLREHRYDLVHTHSPFPSSLTRIVAPGAGVRAIVHTEHSLPGSRNLITRAANRLTYPRCDLVVSVSKVVDDEVHRVPLFQPRASRVIHGGINQDLIDGVVEREVEIREELGIPPGDVVVGNVAHLRSQKGHEVWLQTARRVLEAAPNTSFVIVGREKEPGYKRRLEDMAVELGIGAKVRFAGFKEDPFPYMATFDVFFMASEFEGFPIALVEAMAMGIPVVATDVGGVREALGPSGDGSMAPAGDATGLAAHVTGLLSDLTRRRELGSALRSRALSEFTLETMVKRVEEAYADVLGLAVG